MPPHAASPCSSRTRSGHMGNTLLRKKVHTHEVRFVNALCDISNWQHVVNEFLICCANKKIFRFKPIKTKLIIPSTGFSMTLTHQQLMPSGTYISFLGYFKVNWATISSVYETSLKSYYITDTKGTHFHCTESVSKKVHIASPQI